MRSDDGSPGAPSPHPEPVGPEPVGRALVTGASSGIGEAFARALAARGWDLVLVARRRARLEALAAALAGPGTDHEVLTADLTDPGDLATVADRLADGASPVGMLVNNAGFGSQGQFWTRPIDVELAEVALNVVAPVRLAHAAVGAMVTRGEGAVVNVSSLSSLQPLPHWATYSSTKAFLSTFSAALGAELAGTGVRILDVKPGFTRTEFQDQSSFSREIVPGPLWLRAEQVAEASLRALDRGAEECLPGWQSALLARLSRLSPWPLQRAVLLRATRHLRKR